MAIPKPNFIYRMVHWKNVGYILKNGLCSKNHKLADPNYINIGHKKLIVDRKDKDIPIEGAGLLGEYIPFYFAGHSPMLLMIKNGTPPVEKIPQEDIVFLISTVEKVKQFNLEYVFTDMHAKLALAHFFNDDAGFDSIKWDIVKSLQWKNTEDNRSRKDYKQAGFLVRNYMPVNCITHIGVKTERRKTFFDKMIANLALNISVGVDKNCKLYYK